MYCDALDSCIHRWQKGHGAQAPPEFMKGTNKFLVANTLRPLQIIILFPILVTQILDCGWVENSIIHYEKYTNSS